MAGKSDWLENAFLDQILGAVSFPVAATVWVALYTTTPSETGGGVEVTGGGYARAAVVNNTTNWPVASTASLTKFNAVSIGYVQASASWGTVSGFAIMSASAAGNMYYFGTLSTARAIEVGDTAQFASRDILITEE